MLSELTHYQRQKDLALIIQADERPHWRWRRLVAGQVAGYDAEADPVASLRQLVGVAAAGPAGLAAPAPAPDVPRIMP